MKKTLILSTLAALIMIFGCSQGNNESDADTANSREVVNPNGTSELAQLMRDMFEAGMASKKQIAAGESPAIELDYEQFLSAHPTDSAMIDYPQYESMARAYIQAMQRLEQADASEAAEAHMTMVSTCRSCHTISCRGPLAKIDKLALPGE